MGLSDSDAVSHGHILVVEDEEPVADIIADALHEDGYAVSVCSSGTDALAFIRTNEIDLVLLDVMLQDMDGLIVARQMKEFVGSDSFMPIIIVSGLSGEEDKIRGLAYADDYITKPFANDELCARVHAMLRIRLLQRQLLESRNRYRFLYQNIPQMCLSLNTSGHIMDCNIAFSREMGKIKDGIVGRPLYEFVSPEYHNELRSYFMSLRSGRTHSRQPSLELPARTATEIPRKITLRGVYVSGGDSAPSILLVMQDINRMFREDEEQRLARRHLYRSAQMVSIGTLASGVAHELNNPLAAILGFSDALINRLESNESIDETDLGQYLSIIKSESLRCRDIIDNLLRFSRDREPQMRDISLLDCIQSACSLLSSRASKKHVTIDNRVPPDIIIKADLQRLGQVFLNVLSNAIDFSSEASSVSIALQQKPDDRRHVTVEIVDQGQGISSEILPRVFDPFFTTKEVGYGMGVGLAICHKAMEECEGSIDIVSETGKGTTVILDIPKGGSV